MVSARPDLRKEVLLVTLNLAVCALALDGVAKHRWAFNEANFTNWFMVFVWLAIAVLRIATVHNRYRQATEAR